MSNLWWLHLCTNLFLFQPITCRILLQLHKLHFVVKQFGWLSCKNLTSIIHVFWLYQYTFRDWKRWFFNYFIIPYLFSYREYAKQISKMLISVHAMDHVTNLPKVTWLEESTMSALQNLSLFWGRLCSMWLPVMI